MAEQRGNASGVQFGFLVPQLSTCVTSPECQFVVSIRVLHGKKLVTLKVCLYGLTVRKRARNQSKVWGLERGTTLSSQEGWQRPARGTAGRSSPNALSGAGAVLSKVEPPTPTCKRKLKPKGHVERFSHRHSPQRSTALQNNNHLQKRCILDTMANICSGYDNAVKNPLCFTHWSALWIRK